MPLQFFKFVHCGHKTNKHLNGNNSGQWDNTLHLCCLYTNPCRSLLWMQWAILLWQLGRSCLWVSLSHICDHIWACVTHSIFGCASHTPYLGMRTVLTSFCDLFQFTMAQMILCWMNISPQTRHATLQWFHKVINISVLESLVNVTVMGQTWIITTRGKQAIC